MKIAELSSQSNFRELIYLPPTLVIAGVHMGMVVPGFQILATEEQCKKWVPKLKDFTAIGCYA